MIQYDRRESDSAVRRAVILAERIILWGSVCGLIVAVVTQYVRMKDVVDGSPAIVERVTVIEKTQAVESAVGEERWRRIETWMQRIERKIDRTSDNR